jgi:hypothetical protein
VLFLSLHLRVRRDGVKEKSSLLYVLSSENATKLPRNDYFKIERFSQINNLILITGLC